MKDKAKAEAWLEELDKNKKKRIGQYNYGKCHLLVNKIRQSEDIVEHRKMVAKYVAYLSLGNVLWACLFHWIYWRYLYGFKTQEDMQEVLEKILGDDNKEAGTFFASLGWIQANHSLIVRGTKQVSSMNTEAKQD